MTSNNRQVDEGRNSGGGVVGAPIEEKTTRLSGSEKRDGDEILSDNTPENNAATTEDAEEFKEGGYGW